MAFKNKKAHDAMTRARTILVVQQRFFGVLALQLQLVEVEDKNTIPTMGVDGRHLFYNPEYTLGLKEPEVLGVIAHEVMHCALKHMIRRGHRNPIVYNMAGDFVINLILKEAKFELPGKPVTMKSPPGTKGHLLDPAFADMGTEEIYERLMREVKFVKVIMKGGDKDFGGCGSVLDATGSPGDKKDGNGEGTSKEEIEATWDANVRMAVSVAKGAHAGNLPAYLKRLVDEFDRPRVNWREQLRDFISNSMIKDYSWARPNRRLATSGILLPGLISDSMQKLLWIMDVSGSITEEQHKRAASEGQGALDDGVCDTMTLIYTDTKVKKVDEFNRGELIKVETPGGGGTDFKKVMEYVLEHHSDAQAIVFITDMMTCSFGEDPGIPVLWGATLPHSQLKTIQVPFGRVIEVDTNG
jgi:predicted metal-dependent peptidase